MECPSAFVPSAAKWGWLKLNTVTAELIPASVMRAARVAIEMTNLRIVASPCLIGRAELGTTGASWAKLSLNIAA